VNIQATKYV